VEAVLLVVPELDPLGHHPVATPGRWARDLTLAEALDELGDPVLQKPAMTALWCEAQAPIWLGRGRVRQ
jgi:hypothetical protein